jgi:hypothetical protein
MPGSRSRERAYSAAAATAAPIAPAEVPPMRLKWKRRLSSAIAPA